MKCKSCRVTFEGTRYEISADGSVRQITRTPDGPLYGETLPADNVRAYDVRREAQRQRRNRNARDRNEVMRSLGLVKTPYGWE